MKAYVNKDICIGCGLCNSIAHNIFILDKDGLAEINTCINSENEIAIQEASSSCPVEAIIIE